MGRIVISTNMSLDGVVQDPDGREGSPVGGWFDRYGGPDLAEWASLKTREAMDAAGLLLGRRSDEWFAARWICRSGHWADKLNSLPKYVVSSTPGEPRWTNATVLSGDVVAEIGKLKAAVDGELLVYASCELSRTLIEHDQVDEVRLVVFPVLLGPGTRLIADLATAKSLRLVDTRTVGAGLTHLTYAFVR